MNTHKTVILQTTQRAFTFFRMLRLLLNLTLMSLSACSTTATRYDNASNMPEQSRIHVEPFSKYDDVSPATADAAGLMTRIITEQLAMENRLQTALDSESLILHGAILSFEDAMLDVQGELYAGEEFVAYSRIKRQVKQPEQMAQTIELITAQLLDELMAKLRDQPANPFGEYFQPDPDGKQTGDPKNDSYYQHWGWWRQRQDKPGNDPEKHWDSDVKPENLPRSGRVIGDISAKKAELAKTKDSTNESSTFLTVLGVIGVVLVFVLAAALADSGDSKSHCRGEYHHCSPVRH